MVKITAKGKIRGVAIEVVVVENDNRITIEANDLIKIQLSSYMKMIPKIGGTFIPDKGSILSYYSIFMYSDFFDNSPKVDIIGELPTLPYEDGVIY